MALIIKVCKKFNQYINLFKNNLINIFLKGASFVKQHQKVFIMNAMVQISVE
jgi:hypothetical protein